MRVSERFIRGAAAAQCVSGLTTLGLIFLARGFRPVTDIVTAVERLDDPLYLLRLAVGIVHPFIVLFGALGIAVVRVAHATGAVVTAVTFLLLWAGTEAVQQAIALVAVQWTWRAALAGTPDAATVLRLRSHIEGADGLTDAMFLVILMAFVVANVALAVATWQPDALSRAVSVGFVLAAALGVISGLTAFGTGVLPPAVMAVLYPALQPPARVLTGIWLWRHARSPSLAPPSPRIP